MKRIAKFCHIHNTPEGQILFKIKQDEENGNYGIEATIAYDEVDVSVSLMSGEWTKDQAVEILETTKYDKYADMMKEQLIAAGIWEYLSPDENGICQNCKNAEGVVCPNCDEEE